MKIEGLSDLKQVLIIPYLSEDEEVNVKELNEKMKAYKVLGKRGFFFRGRKSIMFHQFDKLIPIFDEMEKQNYEKCKIRVNNSNLTVGFDKVK